MPSPPLSHLRAFDRYAPFTDLAALKAASTRPLRKCIRVNTLKSSVERIRAWGRERGWDMTPVPWCAEGFFVDREDHSVALGKDMLHLLGHIYLQEASSMLPVTLLHPLPGESVFDMAAAPGSKTTQIAARMALSPGGASAAGGMGAVRGVIVANDVQEKRLWTLKSAIHRQGVTNVVVTKKVGQWFARQMTERFDRVLCDAPCSAQGTVRKDSDALAYCGPENIAKMARLQRELLEAAVHSAKVGGTIVYSTCTLTPEENEAVVAWALQKFAGLLEAVDPRHSGAGTAVSGPWVDCAVADSHRVQDWLERQGDWPLRGARLPLIRLWPQTANTEGFFCAVLRKTASTRPVEVQQRIPPQETALKRAVQEEILHVLEQTYGSRFLREGEVLAARADQVVLTTQDVLDFHLPVQDYALGMPFGRVVKDRFGDTPRGGRVRLASEFVALRGQRAVRNRMDVSDAELLELFEGKDIACSPDLSGDVILLWRELPIGWGLAQGGLLKNRLSRWVVGHRAA